MGINRQIALRDEVAAIAANIRDAKLVDPPDKLVYRPCRGNSFGKSKHVARHGDVVCVCALNNFAVCKSDRPDIVNAPVLPLRDHATNMMPLTIGNVAVDPRSPAPFHVGAEMSVAIEEKLKPVPIIPSIANLADDNARLRCLDPAFNSKRLADAPRNPTRIMRYRVLPVESECPPFMLG